MVSLYTDNQSSLVPHVVSMGMKIFTIASASILNILRTPTNRQRSILGHQGVNYDTVYHLRNYTNSPNYFTKFQLFYTNSNLPIFWLQIKNTDLQDSFFSLYMYFIVYMYKVRSINLIILFSYLLLCSNYI
jgi:hypothetical protein